MWSFILQIHHHCIWAFKQHPCAEQLGMENLIISRQVVIEIYVTALILDKIFQSSKSQTPVPWKPHFAMDAI